MAKKSKKSAKKKVAKVVRKPAKKAAPKKAAARKAVAKSAVKSAPKPKGSALTGVGPSFTVADIDASVTFYCDIMGFKVVERWETGEYRGAHLEREGVTVFLNQDDWKQGRDRVKGQGVRVFVFTGPNIDAYANAIKSRGAVLAQEPKDEWGMRAFGIDDPDGFKLTFMTKLAKG